MQPEPTTVTLPTRNDIKLFLWYTVWAAISGIAPAVAFIGMSLLKYSDSVDWEMAGGIASTTVVLSVLGSWREHVALLKPPPGWVPMRMPPGLLKS